MSAADSSTKQPESRAFESRILQERAKIKSSVEQLMKRVEQSGHGPKSKEILRKTLDHESIGHLYWDYLPVHRS